MANSKPKGESTAAIWTIRQTYEGGCYRTESSVPLEVADKVRYLTSRMSYLNGNTLQYLCLDDGLWAIIVSREGDDNSHSRRGISKYAAIFGSRDAEKLMRHPVSIFRLAHYMTEKGTALPSFLKSWPEAVTRHTDDEIFFAAVPFTSAMLSAYTVLLGILYGGKTLCYVADDADINDEQLLAVLYALPLEKRIRVSFSYGYSEGCVSNRLQLVIRRPTDPLFDMPPACAAVYTGDCLSNVQSILTPHPAALNIALDGEPLSPKTLWTPKRLLKLATWQPEKNTSRRSKANNADSFEEYLAPCKSGCSQKKSEMRRRNAFFIWLRRLVLLASAAAMLLWAVHPSTVGSQFQFEIVCSGNDIIRMGAVFLAGFFARSILRRKDE